MKICSQCRKEQSPSEFYNSGKYLQAHCKSCGRERSKEYYHKNKHKASFKENEKRKQLHKSYGLSLEEYNKRLERQGGVCVICGSKDSHRKLSVDHDHETGRIRGLLCSSCNIAIGLLGDNACGVRKALDYLEGEDANTPVRH